MIQLNIYRIKTYWNKKCCQSFCGRYCGRNCANDDTSMKFCKKVYKAVLLKTKLLATKKKSFFLKMATGNISNIVDFILPKV